MEQDGVKMGVVVVNQRRVAAALKRDQQARHFLKRHLNRPNERVALLHRRGGFGLAEPHLGR